jgi:hypothetical protein
VKNTFFCKKNSINVHGNILSLELPLVMGILNATPDSFYDGKINHQACFSNGGRRGYNN